MSNDQGLTFDGATVGRDSETRGCERAWAARRWTADWRVRMAADGRRRAGAGRWISPPQAGSGSFKARFHAALRGRYWIAIPAWCGICGGHGGDLGLKSPAADLSGGGCSFRSPYNWRGQFNDVTDDTNWHDGANMMITLQSGRRWCWNIGTIIERRAMKGRGLGKRTQKCRGGPALIQTGWHRPVVEQPTPDGGDPMLLHGTPKPPNCKGITVVSSDHGRPMWITRKSSDHKIDFDKNDRITLQKREEGKKTSPWTVNRKPSMDRKTPIYHKSQRDR